MKKTIPIWSDSKKWSYRIFLPVVAVEAVEPCIVDVAIQRSSWRYASAHFFWDWTSTWNSGFPKFSCPIFRPVWVFFTSFGFTVHSVFLGHPPFFHLTPCQIRWRQFRKKVNKKIFLLVFKTVWINILLFGLKWDKIRCLKICDASIRGIFHEAKNLQKIREMASYLIQNIEKFQNFLFF